MRAALAFIGLVCLSGCSSGSKPTPAANQREADSILGASKLPGAHVVKRATAAADSVAARRAVEDSIAGPP